MATANSRRQEWSISGHDFFLDLGAPRPAGIRRRIEDSLREAIRSGRLGHGALLPPTRALARDLGVSRGTVTHAYAQLAAEGWITGLQGSGTRIAVRHELLPLSRQAGERRRRWRFDFRHGRPDPSSFPRREWLRASRHALASTSDAAFDYGSPEGHLELRLELAAYLARARGLRVEAPQLIVTTGFTQGLGLVARALGASGVRRVAIEEPSMALYRMILRAAGLEVVLLGVDERGARIEELDRVDVGAVVLTPNRQHPTGVLLAPERRAALLEWARSSGGLVIEDDYDGEFRYDRRPIGPLQGLDPSSVVYGGTTSKTLAPALRLGWLVVPEAIHSRVRREKALADWHTSTIDQVALAQLLRSGDYDRHIRKMRLRYRRRRDVLVKTLQGLDRDLDILGEAAGLNLLIRLTDPAVERAALASANAAGIGLGGLAQDAFYERTARGGLIVGYAAASEHTFAEATTALAQVIANVRL
ncbi:MAG TPA: PLP-dependent aminotransferase family protein [Gaiella sp.]|uniref:MocR-like pyridoxine biosynthesis transcription factor PdxR n=1 Tax=Gaiella sp. TaxID=2663207 RepID=UPI002D7EEEDD|nr:PLP-dependent aminotransferase family protein [Gaiella sp.]HET9286665.1 PLP-dependent aminotransferase family protein [Gaiella sp.]